MFEGTAPNRTAKQEPRTKIQQNKWHFFHAPQVKGFICGVHVLYLHDIRMIFAWFRRVNNLHLLLFYLQYPPPVCLVCCIPRVQTMCATFLSLVSPTYLRALPSILGQNLRGTACITFHSPEPRRLFTWLQTSVCIDFAKKAQACKDMKQATKKRKRRSSIQPRSRA